MGSLKDTVVEQDIPDSLPDEAQHDFRRKVFYQGRCRIPRRYVVAIILCPILVIQTWMYLNISCTTIQALYSMGGIENHTLGEWTYFELKVLNYILLSLEIVSQIPGALLIYLLSSHKVLPVSVVVASVLHMLTPLALQHHSYTFVGILLSQWVITAPLKIAVISVWKDWAPPGERTRLLAITFFGSFLFYASNPFLAAVWEYNGLAESFYIAGCSGLIWSLLWYFLTSDSPSNDSWISENEYLYLQNTIPSEGKETSKISEIPWRSILISKPVLSLCLVHYKTAFSLGLLTSTITHMLTRSPFYEVFLTSYVVIIPFTAVLADFLIRKLNGRATLIRKCFFCGASVLHAFFLLGMISRSELTKAIFYLFSFMVLAVSIPGYITIALDLSPRYISILAGLFFMCELLGLVTYIVMITNTFTYFKKDEYGVSMIFDGILSLFATGIFFLWGSADEQLWSMRFASSPRSNDYLSFPKPEDEDDINLVSNNP